MDNEFPGDAGFVCDKLPTTAALSTREKVCDAICTGTVPSICHSYFRLITGS